MVTVLFVLPQYDSLSAVVAGLKRALPIYLAMSEHGLLSATVILRGSGC